MPPFTTYTHKPKSTASDERESQSAREGDEREEASKRGGVRRGEGPMDVDITAVKALAVVIGGGVSLGLAIGTGLWVMKAYRSGRLERVWRRVRVGSLGGVTTLERKLSYDCAMCQYSMDANEEVRKLSCNHVFHSRKETAKCKEVFIDEYLRREGLSCPICRRTPLPVLPWKAHPPLSSAPASASATATSSAASTSSEPLLQQPSGGSDEEDPELPVSTLPVDAGEPSSQ